MIVKSIWLIHHKASISPDSPVNDDGSTFMQGVGVVPAVDMQEALTLFETYLTNEKMTILELWKCEQWEPKKFSDDILEVRQINHAASTALQIQ